MRITAYGEQYLCLRNIRVTEVWSLKILCAVPWIWSRSKCSRGGPLLFRVYRYVPLHATHSKTSLSDIKVTFFTYLPHQTASTTVLH